MALQWNLQLTQAMTIQRGSKMSKRQNARLLKAALQREKEQSEKIDMLMKTVKTLTESVSNLLDQIGKAESKE